MINHLLYPIVLAQQSCFSILLFCWIICCKLVQTINKPGFHFIKIWNPGYKTDMENVSAKFIQSQFMCKPENAISWLCYLLALERVEKQFQASIDSALVENIFAVEPCTKLHTRLLLYQFCMTLLWEIGESNKTNGNKVLYDASCEAPLSKKTRL